MAGIGAGECGETCASIDADAAGRRWNARMVRVLVSGLVVAFGIARKLLRAATGGIIEAADVFPRPDGGVTVAIYFSGRDLAFNIKPSGVVDVDSETDPDFPFLSELSAVHILFILQGLRQWNSSFSYTFPNTMRRSIGFEALVSKDLETAPAFPFSKGSALRKRQDQYVLMPGPTIAA